MAVHRIAHRWRKQAHANDESGLLCEAVGSNQVGVGMAVEKRCRHGTGRSALVPIQVRCQRAECIGQIGYWRWTCSRTVEGDIEVSTSGQCMGQGARARARA